MPGIATGVAKIFSYKKNVSAFGTPVAGGAGAQQLRRIEGLFGVDTDTFESDEVTPTYQTTDIQVGQQRAKGSIKGRFSGKTYMDFMAGVLGQAWQVAPTTGALVNVTAAVGPVSFTRAAGSYITDGFRVGDMVQWVGWATTGIANNNRYFLILTLTATVMTGVFLDGTAGGAKAAGDSVTCTLVGKKNWIPQSGHTKDLFDFEEYHPDLTVTESELFVSMWTSSMQITQDPKGYMGVDFSLMGAKQQNSSAAPYFTGPTAITSTRLHNLLDGALYLGGTLVADVTGFQLGVDTQGQLADPTYGTRVPADVFPGRKKVSGQMSCYFRDKTLRDNFLTRTKLAFIGVSRVAQLAQSDTAVICVPSVTLLSADKNDGQSGGTVRQYNFSADNNIGSTGSDQTTVSFQDSTVP